MSSEVYQCSTMIAMASPGHHAGDDVVAGDAIIVGGYINPPLRNGITLEMTMDTVNRNVGDAIIVGGYINPPLRNGITLEMTVSATYHNV